jgi:hypothetical protein
MMRPLIPSLAAALALSACASSTGPTEGYNAATDRLAAECRERGGILTPTGGATGRAETDNVCRISGGTARPGRN